MKPELEKVETVQNGSFIAKRVIRKNRPLLTQAWHYHPEIEICLSNKSVGNRYVGNDISPYERGDLVLIGSMLPHGFTTTEQCEQIVLQLTPDFLGRGFFDHIELHKIKELLRDALLGIQYIGETNLIAQEIIFELMAAEGFDRLILFLRLLQVLATSDERRLICSPGYAASIKVEQLSRMKTVFDYLEKHYDEDINITEVAALIGLTESGFYKFIKKHTKKKFTQIVNEYRVNNATKKLIEDDMTVAEICYSSGFNNLSYFNRRFKEIMGVSPVIFREKYN